MDYILDNNKHFDGAFWKVETDSLGVEITRFKLNGVMNGFDIHMTDNYKIYEHKDKYKLLCLRKNSKLQFNNEVETLVYNTYNNTYVDLTYLTILLKKTNIPDAIIQQTLAIFTEKDTNND